jgi:hypothetical protein
VTEPIFWLGCSILLVAVCLAAALVMAIPALTELARAARSVEKLADTLNRELPPTLEAIRLTGLELTDLSDDLIDGVQSATKVARQVDQGFSGARQQVKDAQVTARSLFVGVKAAWRTWTRPPRRNGNRPNRRPIEQLAADYQAGYQDYQEEYQNYAPEPDIIPPDSANPSLNAANAAQVETAQVEQVNGE